MFNLQLEDPLRLLNTKTITVLSMRSLIIRVMLDNCHIYQEILESTFKHVNLFEGGGRGYV